MQTNGLGMRQNHPKVQKKLFYLRYDNDNKLFCLLGDADEIGIPKTHTWYFNGYETDECFDKYFENPTEHRPPTCYLGFPCTKVGIKSHLSHSCILSSI